MNPTDIIQRLCDRIGALNVRGAPIYTLDTQLLNAYFEGKQYLLELANQKSQPLPGQYWTNHNRDIVYINEVTNEVVKYKLTQGLYINPATLQSTLKDFLESHKRLTDRH